MAETVQLVFEVRKETVDSAAKSLNDLKNKANAVSKSLEKLKSASGMKAIADLNAKINKQSEQLAKLGIELNKTKTKLANVKSGFKDQVNSLKKSEKATKDQIKILKAYNNAQGQVNKTHNVAIAAMGKAVKEAESYEETIKKLKAEIAKLRGEQEKGITGVQKMDAAIRDASNTINKNGKFFAQLTDRVKAYKQVTIESKSILRDYEQQLNAVKNQMRQTTDATTLKTLEGMKDKLTTEMQTVAEKKHLFTLQLLRDQMTLLSKRMGAFGTSVKNAGRTLSRYLTMAMGAAVVMGVKMAANIEAQIVRFQVLTGHMEKGARLYRQIVEFSARTPFLLPDLGEAAQTLLAFGSPLKSVMDELQRLGDLAMGDADKLDSIVMSFGKVRSRGTAHMRELNRFIMAGIPIFQELNKNIGVTGEELFKMVEKNQITFKHVEQAVQSLTNEGGRFHEMTLKVSKTLEGRFSTALDNLRINLASLADPFVEDIKEILVTFIDWSQGFRALSEGARAEIAKLIASLAAIGPALIALGTAISFVGSVLNPTLMLLKALVIVVGVLVGKNLFDNLKSSMEEAAHAAKLTAEYTERLNRASSYSKDIIPGLSREVYELAKAHNAVAEAVELSVRAQTLERKLDRGFEADKEAQKKMMQDWAAFLDLSKIFSIDFYSGNMYKEFIAEKADEWYASISNEIAFLRTRTALEEKLGLTGAQAESSFYEILTGVFSGFDQAAADMESGLSTTAIVINKFRQQEKNINNALQEYIINLTNTTDLSSRELNKKIVKAREDAAYAIDAITENVKALVKTRISEIKADTEGIFLIRDLLGLTNEKDTIKVIESQIDAVVEEIKGFGYTYSELLGFLDNPSVTPEEIAPLIKWADELKLKLGQATRHKERLNLFKTFFEEDIKSVEITKIENQLNEAYEKLASALDGKTIEEIFTAMSTGTLEAMISSTDETTQRVYEQAVILYDRLQDLTEKASNQRSLLEAFVGGQETFEEFKRNLQISQYYDLLEQEINKELARIKKAYGKMDDIEWVRGLQKGLNKLPDINLQSVTQLLDELSTGNYENESIEALINGIQELSATIGTTKDTSILEAFMTDEDAFRLQERMKTAMTAATEALSALVEKSQFANITDLLMGRAELSATNKQKLADILDGVSEFFTEEAEKEDYTGWMKAFVAGPEDFAEFAQEMQVEEWYKSLYEKLESEAIIRKMSISDLLTLGEFNDSEIKKLIGNIQNTFTEEAKKVTGNVSLIEAYFTEDDPTAFFQKEIQKINNQAIADEIAKIAETSGIGYEELFLKLLNGTLPKDVEDKVKEALKSFGIMVEELSPLDTFLDKITNTLENSVTPAFKKLGESIALGATGMEAMGAAIGSIGQAIMDALPELLFKAGVDLIADSQWGLGIGFIAASGIVAGLNGYLGASVAETKITESPANSISYSAKGDVFGNGYIARGPIGRSTNYGVSVIGEAGDEAVMPLTRGSGGKLGVAGMGGDVYVTVNNNTSSQVETKETTNSDGSKSIEFLVYDTVKKGLSNGEFDRPMANSYGIARRGRY